MKTNRFYEETLPEGYREALTLDAGEGKLGARLAAAAMIVMCWLYLLIAVFIKNDDPGPVFFTQKRVGMGKKLFKLLRNDNDYAIFRWLLDCLQQSILCLLCHHLTIADNIYLILTTVRLDTHGINNFSSDTINRKNCVLIMSHSNYIRVII